MPVTTRKMSERQRQEEQKYGNIDDLVANYAMMYPVFFVLPKYPQRYVIDISVPVHSLLTYLDS